MSTAALQPVSIAVGEQRGQVSGLLLIPNRARVCYVLAHGAGAGMAHPFLEAFAGELAMREIATLRFQFPFMERGSKRPDAPALAQETVRAAVAEASRLLPGLPLVAGGRSFGGRMASEAQSASELANVRGLAFLGFPLHPPKRPSSLRAKHLFAVKIPMLFLQGTRDELAELQHLRSVCDELGDLATLRLIEGADHGFRARASSGRTEAEIRRELAEWFAEWLPSLSP